MLWHFSWFQPRNHDDDDDDDFTSNALESIVCIQVALHVSDGEVLWKTCQLLIGRTGKKAAKKCSIFSYFFFLFVVAIFFYFCGVFIQSTWHFAKHSFFSRKLLFFFFRTDRYILVHIPTFYSTWILYDCSYNSRKKAVLSLSLLHFFVLSFFCLSFPSSFFLIKFATVLCVINISLFNILAHSVDFPCVLYVGKMANKDKEQRQ